MALRHYENFDVGSSVDRADTEATKFADFGGNILKYSNDGAFYTDTANELIWNQTYEMAKPTIDMCEDYLAIYDKKGTQIYIMTSQGLVSNIETTMTIEQVSIAAQGTVAVLMGDQSNSYLVVYDKNGKELVNGAIYGEDGGYPIAIALFRRIMQSIMDKTINMVRFEFLLKFLHAISVILFLNERRFLLAL